MKKLILITSMIVFIITTSFTPRELDLFAQADKIENELREADNKLDNVSVVISDPKRLKQIQKNIKNNK